MDDNENSYEMKARVTTTPIERTGEIYQEVAYEDVVRGGMNELTRTIIRTKEEAIKKALIKLGWTPPNTKVEEDLRELIRKSRRAFDTELFDRNEGWQKRALDDAEAIIGYTASLSRYWKGEK